MSDMRVVACLYQAALCGDADFSLHMKIYELSHIFFIQTDFQHNKVWRCVDNFPSYRWSSQIIFSWWRQLELPSVPVCSKKDILKDEEGWSGLHDLEFSNPAAKLFFFFWLPWLVCEIMWPLWHCEDLFNYCYVKPEELLHLLIVTDRDSTVLFSTRTVSHGCEMIALHG